MIFLIFQDYLFSLHKLVNNLHKICLQYMNTDSTMHKTAPAMVKITQQKIIQPLHPDTHKPVKIKKSYLILYTRKMHNMRYETYTAAYTN